jgi:outer membrane usher protein FimD/PapC
MLLGRYWFTKSSTNHENLNVSYTLYGTNSSNLSGSISRDSSTSTSQQTTHNNTSLTATNINLNTTQDTKIKGAVCAWVLMLTCLAVMLVSSTVLLFSSALD